MATKEKLDGGLKWGREWKRLVPASMTDPEARKLAEKHEAECAKAEETRDRLKEALNRIGRAKGILSGSESFVMARNKGKTSYNIRIGGTESDTSSDF